MKFIFTKPGLHDAVKKAVQSGNFKAATKPEEADAFIIAVPTPFQEDKFGEYNGMTYKLADMRAVISAAESIVPFLRKGIWWCWNRPPRRAPPWTWSPPSLPAPGWRLGATSIWLIHPNGFYPDRSCAS
ncbi:MAG: hypothetical protein MZU91_01400 [Desulfosudis oleivorans]|nr:hypothetical protein [Desulfosudis oleivorans]